jgi:hypothetical protein
MPPAIATIRPGPMNMGVITMTETILTSIIMVYSVSEVHRYATGPSTDEELVFSISEIYKGTYLHAYLEYT